MDIIVQLIHEASIQYDPDNDQPPPAYKTSPIPLWNIFFIINHLLHKNQHSTQSIGTLVVLPVRPHRQTQLALANHGLDVLEGR
jgi:hypothetical protein